jgi:hypothetical protein
MEPKYVLDAQSYLRTYLKTDPMVGMILSLRLIALRANRFEKHIQTIH